MGQRLFLFFAFKYIFCISLINKMSLTKVALFAIVALLGSAIASQNVALTCKSVASSVCTSTYQFVVTGGYETKYLNYTYCVPTGKNCTVGSSSFNLQSCKIDYKNTNCSTGVCYMYPAQQVCGKDLTCSYMSGSTNISNTYTTNYSCINCANTAGCTKCMYTATDNSQVTPKTSEICLGANCTQGLATSTTTVSPCNNGYDFFSQPCACCVKTNQVSRFCTSNNDVLMQTDVTSWFNKIQGNGQSKIHILVALVLLAFLGLVY